MNISFEGRCAHSLINERQLVSSLLGRNIKAINRCGLVPALLTAAFILDLIFKKKVFKGGSGKQQLT